MTSAAETNRRWLFAAALAGASGALHLGLIDRWGLWLDEIFTLRDVTAPFSVMMERRLGVGHGPVYFSVLWPWVRIFGNGELALRLPSAVAGVLGIVATFLLVDRHVGRRAAGVAALFLLLSSTALLIGLQARMYTLVAAIALVTALCVLRWENRPIGWREGAALTGLFTLGLYTHYSYGLVVAAFGLYLGLRRPPRWKLGVAVPASVLLLAPWAIAARRTAASDPLGWLPTPVWDEPLSLLWKLAFSSPLDWAPWAPALAGGSVLALGVRGVARMGRAGRLLGWLWLAPIGIAAVLAIWLDVALLREPRYFAVPLLAQTALVAGAVASLPRPLATAVAALCAGVLLFGVVRYATEPPHPGWREAAAFVASQQTPDDAVVVLAPRSASFRHYFRGHAYGAPGQRRGFEEIASARDLPAGTTGVWLVVSPDVAAAAASGGAEGDAASELLLDLRRQFDEGWTRRHDGVILEYRTQRDLPAGEAERLRALGYVDWERAVSEASGVTIHRASEADRLHLYSSRPRAQAHLISTSGRVVHSWRGTSAWGGWQHVELLPGGDLLALVKDEGVLRLGWDSEIVWETKLRAHHDLAVAPDGTLRVLARKRREVRHDGREVPILDDVIVEISPEGTLAEEISLHDLYVGRMPTRQLDRLAAAVAEGDPESLSRLGEPDSLSDVFHTNSIELVSWGAEGEPEPALLLSIRQFDRIAVVSLERRTLLWEWGDGVLDAQHHASLLDDGGVLVFDNGPRRGASRILRVDPESGGFEVVYEAPGFFSRTQGGVEERPRGHLLITESTKGRVFEVDPSGRVVWEFWNPDLRAGAGDRLERAVVYRLAVIDPTLLPSRVPGQRPSEDPGQR